MLKFAIGELGLKPWEYYDMSPDEYNMYCQGYFIRMQRDQLPFRKLYQLIYNVNAPRGKGITSLGSLSNHWPLPLIDRDNTILSSREKMKETWARITSKKEKRELEKLKNGNAEPGNNNQ